MMSMDTEEVYEIVKDYGKRITTLERLVDVLSNKIDTTNKLLFCILTTGIVYVVNSILERI